MGQIRFQFPNSSYVVLFDLNGFVRMGDLFQCRSLQKTFLSGHDAETQKCIKCEAEPATGWAGKVYFENAKMQWQIFLAVRFTSWNWGGSVDARGRGGSLMSTRALVASSPGEVLQ